MQAGGDPGHLKDWADMNFCVLWKCLVELCHQTQMVSIALCFDTLAVGANSHMREDEAVDELSSSLGIRWDFCAAVV